MNVTVWKYGNHIVALTTLAFLAACGGGGGHAAPPPTLTSISVAPATSTLRVSGGRTQQLYATGFYSNTTTQDITGSVTWAINPASTAINVTAGGLVSVGTCGTPPCTATVTATITPSNGTFTSSATVTVRPDAFTIAQTGDPLAGQQWHLRNTGQTAYSDFAGTAGFDISAEPVYSNTTAAANICGTGAGCTGYGVKVAVVDTGLEIAHEDLATNVIRNGSWNFNTATTNPTNTTTTTGDHGTSVAGIIASQAYNGKGGMGVAPEASLKGFNFISSIQSAPYIIAALGGSAVNPNSADVAIFNQSFGTSTTTPMAESSTYINQYAYGASTLRGGLGALYVKAAGNGFGDIDGDASTCGPAIALGISCENSNHDFKNTLPYNIVVGALKASGTKSSYSTTGSSLWVTAPGGEYGGNNAAIGAGYLSRVYEPAIITTDQSGCASGYSQTTSVGYTHPVYGWIPTVLSTIDGNTGNTGVTPPAPNASCNYTNGMNGTSAATPSTAGVIALMLEANPNLTWRDVKHILASTPTIQPAKAAITTTLNAVSYTAEQGWVTNAAGYSYHNWYGFGVVNASAAVAMAKTTCPAGCFTGSITVHPGTSAWSTTSVAGNPNIPDNSATGVSSTTSSSISGAPAFIESVQIQVTISHSYWGDLGIELTSPSGTKSILKNIRDGFNYDNDSTPANRLKTKTMVLSTNAFYGETGNGNWTIKVVDGNNATNTTGGTLSSWGLRIYGH